MNTCSFCGLIVETYALEWSYSVMQMILVGKGCDNIRSVIVMLRQCIQPQDEHLFDSLFWNNGGTGAVEWSYSLCFLKREISHAIVL